MFDFSYYSLYNIYKEVIDMLENKIKEIIIKQYGSVKSFAKIINIPYTTLDTILKRGLLNSNVLNVIKICKELNIDINELINNKIVYKNRWKNEKRCIIY